MAIIKVKKIPRKEISTGDILGRFIYYYPQYTYRQARLMPYKRIVQLLNVADREYAIRMLDLINIVAAPHSKDNSAINNLISNFKGRLEK
jgi:hypothetical protein